MHLDNAQLMTDLGAFLAANSLGIPIKLHPAFSSVTQKMLLVQASPTSQPLEGILKALISATYEVIKPEWCAAVADVSDYIVTSRRPLATNVPHY